MENETLHRGVRPRLSAVLLVAALVCLGTAPLNAQYARADDLNVGRIAGGALMGMTVGVVTGLSVDVFRANVLEDYFEGEPTLSHVAAHLSPWFTLGGAAGLVGIGLREDATAGHVWGRTWRAAALAGLGGLAAGLVSGAVDNEGLSTVLDGATAGALIGVGAGALSGFVMATWAPDTEYGAPANGLAGAAAALPLISWTWRF